MLILCFELIFICVLLLTLGLVYWYDFKRSNARKQLANVSGFWDGREKRRSIRIKAKFNVEYELEIKSNKSTPAETKDIGLGGICILTYVKLSEHSPIRIHIPLPTRHRPVTTSGVVVWCQDLGEENNIGKRLFAIGVKFVFLNALDKIDLNRYITDLKSQNAEEASSS